MKVRLKNQATGIIKEAPAPTFSWTTLIFGVFPCLIRGYWKGVLLQMGGSLLTMGITSLIFPFIINKMYINDLLEKGYVPCTDEDAMVLVSKGIVAASQYNK